MRTIIKVEVLWSVLLLLHIIESVVNASNGEVFKESNIVIDNKESGVAGETFYERKGCSSCGLIDVNSASVHSCLSQIADSALKTNDIFRQVANSRIFTLDGAFSPTVFYDTNRLFSLLARPGFRECCDTNGDSLLTFLLSRKYAKYQYKEVITVEDFRDINDVARRNRVVLLKMLIKMGCDVNHQGRFRKTPLRWAVEGGNIEECKLLVEAGAKLDKDKALDWGRWASKDIAKWLAEVVESEALRGVSPYSTNEVGPKGRDGSPIKE